MPVLSGSMTYARFFVEGALPADFRERFLEALSLRAMRPLSADEDVEERSGWCVLGDPYALELSYERVFYNNYLNLGFRTDRWSLPAALLKTQLREAEQAYLASKGREKLSPRERAELKEVVVRELRKQFSPSVRAVDLSWSLEEGTVRFFSHSARTIGAMADLFAQTFKLELTIEAPYTLARRLGLSEAAQQAWDQLEMTQLSAVPPEMAQPSAVGGN